MELRGPARSTQRRLRREREAEAQKRRSASGGLDLFSIVGWAWATASLRVVDQVTAGDRRGTEDGRIRTLARRSTDVQDPACDGERLTAAAVEAHAVQAIASLSLRCCC